MDRDRVLTILAEAGVFLKDGHYVYASGQHGSEYLEKRNLFKNPVATDLIARAIAEQWMGFGIEAVVGPEKGAVILAHLVAFHLSTARNTVFAYSAERKEQQVMYRLEMLSRKLSGFVINGDIKVLAGKRVLVVDDIINSGRSAEQTVDAVRVAGGAVIGVGCIFNRGSATPASVGSEVFMPLIAQRLWQWPESDCPLCKSGVEIDQSHGHGTDFLLRRSLGKVEGLTVL